MRHKSQAGFWGISGAHIPLLCMLTLTNGLIYYQLDIIIAKLLILGIDL